MKALDIVLSSSLTIVDSGEFDFVKDYWRHVVNSFAVNPQYTHIMPFLASQQGTPSVSITSINENYKTVFVTCFLKSK